MGRTRIHIVSFVERIAAFAGNPDECWEWPGQPTTYGYGITRMRGTGKNWAVHRLAYEACVGPIPDGLQLDHVCRNRRCFNPHHLEPVRPRENTVRGANAKRRLTHCQRGHEFTPDNSYVYTRKDNGRTSRRCKQCDRERVRTWRKSA